MKIKIFLIVFLLFINLQGKVLAYDCNFEKIKPGVTKKELEKINIFAYGPTDSDIFTKHFFKIFEQNSCDMFFFKYSKNDKYN